MAFSSWSGTASSNTSINGVNIAENCPAGNMNDMGRQMMADMRNAISPFAETFLDDADAATVRATIGAAQNTSALTAVSALTPAADKLAYYTGASSAALTALSAFMRTVLDDTDQATALSTLGAIGISASSLGNPGYIKFLLPGGGTFMIAWGIATIGQDTLAAVTYPAPFSSFSIPNVSAMNKAVNSANENTGYISGSATTSGFQIYNSENNTYSIPWIAVGV
jgi:hypothetical protein